ncbi:hypothetical protein DH2020_027638 [Rehmannia glutinosa]|uniref:F-box domain-containing protein n=1 Tax=Rehmannia glutinosa TaxID=99300 RepID=A0ABR0VTL3_REHGL
MEKQAAKRREDDGSSSMDRISNLPQPILHHILSFLSQREAIQTCVLSKSWRYLGSTRPNVEFIQYYFNGIEQKFMSIVNKTLQRYHDQKLCMQEFRVEMLSVGDSESISLLEKWIPIVVLNMGVKRFSLYFHSKISPCFDLFSVVFESESLKDLDLQRCKLSPNPLNKVPFKYLEALSLIRVYIAEETFEKIMSNCPLINNLVLVDCEGLKTIKLNKHNSLNYFEFCYHMEYLYRAENDHLSIEIDVPTLKTLTILWCPKWLHHHNYFPNLISLSLNMLSSRSIKHFTIVSESRSSIKAVIDAPNIVQFDYQCDVLPSISFTTTSSEWKSNITYNLDIDRPSSSWFLNLYQLLKALSQSEISLDFLPTIYGEEPDQALVVADNSIYGSLHKPAVVVEYLTLSFYSSSTISAFMNDLFRICRPRYIGPYWYTNARDELVELLYNILVKERRKRHYLWQQDLEEVTAEAFNENGQEWHAVHWTSLLEGDALLPNNQCKQKFRIRLKWTN